MEIQWVKIIYCNIGSVVINNGHASEEFSISRGIRQGCPISPYLFLIAVEVLAISIRSNENISGIKVGNKEIKISQLADDTTLLLANLASVKHALGCLSDLQEISGLKVNIDKTIGMGIGSLNNFKPSENCGIKWTSGPITTLGVTISNEPDKNEKCNFKPRLKTMLDTLNIWLSRNLSLNGKITILKSIAIPKLQFVVSNLPITNNIVADTEKIISNFLWKYKIPKVKKSVIIQPIKQGGIKAPDFTSIVKASRVSWIKRLLTDSDAKWKAVVQELVGPLSIKHLIQTHLCDEYIDNISTPFYRQVLKAWNEIKELPTSADEYIEQIIWYNKLINIPAGPKKKKTSTLFYPKLYKAGIVRVGDLISEEGDILNFNALCRKYNIRLNILSYYQIVKAIPQTWFSAIKSYISNQNVDVNRPIVAENVYKVKSTSEMRIYITKITTQTIYKSFVHQKLEEPSALKKWDNDINSREDWEKIFILPYVTTRETQLQALHYRIIHRFLPCRKWLTDINITQSNKCETCENIDTIEHYIYFCNPVKNIWGQIEKWWNNISECKVILTKKHVIFGIYYDLKYFKAINYVILLAKLYIYKQKLNNSILSFDNFVLYLKYNLKVEQYICEKNGDKIKFEKTWLHIIKKL